MNYYKTRKKILSYLLTSSEKELELFYNLLNNVNEVSLLLSDLQNVLLKKNSNLDSKYNDIKLSLNEKTVFLDNKKDSNSQQEEIENIELFLSNKFLFSNNDEIITFLNNYFPYLVRNKNLRKRSKKEIARIILNSYKKIYLDDTSGVLLLKELIDARRGQSDYNDLFKAIVKPK